MTKVISKSLVAVFIGLAIVASGCSKKKETPVTPPPTCSVGIFAPAGGEVFITGDPVSVRWDKGGSSLAVRLDLIKGDQLVGEIISFWDGGTRSPSFYPWTATTMGSSSGDDYRIAVIDFADSTCSDTTSVFGVVSGCNFRFPYTIKDPIPALNPGGQFTIEWTGYETSGEASLELWKGNISGIFGNVGVIATGQSGSGSFDWTVDTFGSGSGVLFRFLVLDPNNPSCRTFSKNFVIVDPTSLSAE